MQKVANDSEYKAAIHSVKERFGTCRTNCFFMGDHIKKLISQNRFYMQGYEHGMAFFVDEGAYYNLYYFWGEGAAFVDFRQERPVVVESSEPRIKRREEPSFDGLDQLLTEAGFKLFKTNYQLEMKLAGQEPVLRERSSAGERRLEELGLSLSFSDGGESLRQAIDLWESALDPTDIPLDHRTLSEQDALLCIMDPKNRVVATNWWRITGKSAEGRHTVVHPDYYHRGIASFMLTKECLCAVEAGADRVLGWVHEDNTKSLALHEKIGFSFSGKACKQYILD